MKHWVLLAVLTAGVLAAAGCGPAAPSGMPFEVQEQATAQALNQFGQGLSDAGAEVRVHCVGTQCRLKVSQNSEQSLSAQMLLTPFENKPMTYRINGGSQALQGSLYGTLAQFSPRRDFEGGLDERKVTFEHNKVKVRCVATRAALPQYNCWMLIDAAYFH